MRENVYTITIIWEISTTRLEGKTIEKQKLKAMETVYEEADAGSGKKLRLSAKLWWNQSRRPSVFFVGQRRTLEKIKILVNKN